MKLDPTQDQQKFLRVFGKFIFSKKERVALVLSGYAGTGKTTMIGLLVKVLPRIKWRSVLLAPTGRAAKVMSSYAQKSASTIHRKIYRRTSTKDGRSKFVRQKNLHKNTLFLVDESSMIGNDSTDSNLFQGNSLLSDLIDYVYSGENCRILFVGDEAQLPPVGLVRSPAMNVESLTNDHSLRAARIQLREVVRQSEESAILTNATSLRNQLPSVKEGEFPRLEVMDRPDFINVRGTDVRELIETVYADSGRENAIVITRSNKRANYFNSHIRNQVLWFDSELNSGDSIMVIRNNYYWMAEYDDVPVDFIANGDILEIISVRNYEERYGFKFMDAEVRFKDYDDSPEFEVKIMLDAIWSEGPGLSSDQASLLYYEVSKDYQHLSSKRKVYEALTSDPYFNALQVKFAYAVTCHKSQGGQWEVVLIDQGYLTEEMLGQNYLRWLYTAITRASKSVYLLEFDERFFQ